MCVLAWDVGVYLYYTSKIILLFATCGALSLNLQNTWDGDSLYFPMNSYHIEFHKILTFSYGCEGPDDAMSTLH